MTECFPNEGDKAEMAVDFSLLPAEAPLPDNVPSRLVWTVVFFVLFVAGIFAVLMLWPANMATRAPQFWITITVVPFGAASLVVLRRYSAYEAQKLDVMEQNEVNRQFNKRVFDAASQPFAVVALACRISASENEKVFKALLENTLKLETQQSIASGGNPVKARWLSVPGVVLKSGNAMADRDRQIRVIAWLFAELLTELASVIQSLPLGCDLVVQFTISSALTVEERHVLWTNAWQKHATRTMRIDAVERTIDLSSALTVEERHVLWTNAWQKHATRTMRIDAVERTIDLDSIDVWLDHLIATADQQAHLIVAIQLHHLLGRTPPERSAEAAVATLLIPDSLAEQHGIDHQAKLHRPVRSTLSNAHDAMMPALKWAHANGGEISGRWQTGFNDTTATHLTKPAEALGLTAKPMNLDGSVGYAGVAAPWLALACASASLSEARPLQMILSGTPENVDCAVLRRSSAESAPDSTQTSE